MRRLALGIASLLAIVGGVSQASALSVTWKGSYLVTNNSSVAGDKTTTTFPAGALTPLVSTITGSGGVGFLDLGLFSPFTTTSSVFSNSFVYENATKTRGCVFTTLGSFNRSTQRYTYTFSKSAFSSVGVTKPTCVHQNNGVNPVTGVFSSLVTFSGF